MSINIRIKAYILRLLTSKQNIDFDIKKSKKALFFRYDRIGDMIISTPVFRELKLKFPDISITVLASRANYQVLVNNPYVDNIVVNHKNSFFGDLASLIKLRKQEFDVCFELDHSVVPHAIIRHKIIKPKKIISVAKDGRYGVSGDELTIYDYYTIKPKNMHFRDIWLKTLTPFGINLVSNKYDLFLSNKQQATALNFFKKYSSKLKIGINLQGAVKGKKIKEAELKKICKGIKDIHLQAQFFILHIPKDSRSIKKLVEDMGLDFVIPSYKTDKILDVAALIKNLDIVITPDTSISHIASAFNIPIVSIHENNQESYNLFAPTSFLNETVFSPEKDSLDGYDLQKVISLSNKLINKILL